MFVISFLIEVNNNQSVNINVRNKFFKGDIVEVLTKKGPLRKDKINQITAPNGESLSFAQPNSRVSISLNNKCLPNDIIRRTGND
jgi:hypothetical protein